MLIPFTPAWFRARDDKKAAARRAERERLAASFGTPYRSASPSPAPSSDSSSFATSYAVASMTDNVPLGYVAGGSLTGAMLGASSHSHAAPEPAPAPSYSYTPAPAPSYDWGSSSSSCDSSSSSSSSSSYDSSSSSSCDSSSQLVELGLKAHPRSLAMKTEDLLRTLRHPGGPICNEAADLIEQLQRDLARARDTANDLIVRNKELERQAHEHRAFRNMVNRHAPEFPADPDGPRDVWYWQGDGRDHLESMTHQLPVVIRAEQLRELLAAASVQSPA